MDTTDPDGAEMSARGAVSQDERVRTTLAFVNREVANAERHRATDPDPISRAYFGSIVDFGRQVWDRLAPAAP